MNTIDSRRGADRNPVRHGAWASVTTSSLLALIIGFGSLPALGQLWRDQRAQGSRAAVDMVLLDIARREDAWFATHDAYATLPQLGYPVETAQAGLYTDSAGSLSGSASADTTHRITLALEAPHAATGSGSAYWLSAWPVAGHPGNLLGCRSLHAARGAGPGGRRAVALCVPQTNAS